MTGHSFVLLDPVLDVFVAFAVEGSRCPRGDGPVDDGRSGRGSPSCVARVNSRLLAIKPPHTVTRLPRTLNERSFWKASEWRHWLLFYALPCLEDILPLEYWKHFSKLSEAIHMLLRETITPHYIKRAEELLHDFVGRCEGLYGVASQTFNIHQLLHLPNSVRQQGPLWAQSAFVFEGGNGKLVKLVSAAKGLPDQIVERVVMSQQLECVLANHDLAITASERTAPLLPQHLSPAPATVLPLNQHNIPPPQQPPLRIKSPFLTMQLSPFWIALLPPLQQHILWSLDQHHAPPAALPALEILVNRAIKD
ncbi:hypothetical protein HPB47_018402 [Ixodes persulcatus]|uniref:Uncharacterized protein n=1 Tax=Ixodes persulcatus TaxID=34615 RepID=A0AC60QPG6_IXOPE|nr:hypothetical protein HPB47_018402 [Ixodes persulcatus]